MVKPLNSDIAFAPTNMRGSNTYLLESVPAEVRSNSSGRIKSPGLGGRQYEALVADSTTQPTRRGLVSKNRKSNSTVNVARVKRNSTNSSPSTPRGDPKRKSSAVSTQQNRASSSTVNHNIKNSVKSADVAQNPSTTVSPQNNTGANPIAPSASSIAKERAAMNTSLNTALQEVLGKEGFVAPTDHRGYTAMVAKAMKKIKNPAQLEAFKTKIEEAGKPFRLNFGVIRTVNGKQEALNSKTTGSLSTLHQGEYGKIEAEFKTKSKTPTQTTGSPTQQSNQPVNGRPGTTATPARQPVPTPAPTPPKTPVQNTAPEKAPAAVTEPNTSIFPNPELIA